MYLCQKELKQKLTIKDGQRIWKHFQRFCEYEDLKDLYSKVLPEIVKFESKLIDYSCELDKLNEIIKRFDECLIAKCDKYSLKKFRDYVDDSFVLKKSYTDFTKSQLDQIAQFS